MQRALIIVVRLCGQPLFEQSTVFLRFESSLDKLAMTSARPTTHEHCYQSSGFVAMDPIKKKVHAQMEKQLQILRI